MVPRKCDQGLACPNAAARPASRAFDVDTGTVRWIFHTIPKPGEFGYDTWPKDAHAVSGGANAWAGVTVDASLGMVFAATGSASFDFYGVTRHGDDLFADCVLALDARTGRRVWHFQGLKHDLWDWDFPASPNLVTVTRGAGRGAVAQITKQGYVYVLDRRTGRPLFPVEMRKVPPSAVDGEQAAERQPYPVKPPPFARQGLTEDMLTTRTPQAHAAVLAQFKQYSKGFFAPPSFEGTIVLPGFDGGANGAAPLRSGNLTALRNSKRCRDRQADPEQDTPSTTANVRLPPQRTGRGRRRPSLRGDRRSPQHDQIAASSRGHRPHAGLPDMGAAHQRLVGSSTAATRATIRRCQRPSGETQRGESVFLDFDGYPAITPPWERDAIDLMPARSARSVREFPDLAAKGSQHGATYGGPIRQGGGLFIRRRIRQEIPRHDKITGSCSGETLRRPQRDALDIYESTGSSLGFLRRGQNGELRRAIVAFALP